MSMEPDKAPGASHDFKHTAGMVGSEEFTCTKCGVKAGMGYPEAPPACGAPNPDTISDVVGEGTRDEIRDRLRASAWKQVEALWWQTAEPCPQWCGARADDVPSVRISTWATKGRAWHSKDGRLWARTECLDAGKCVRAAGPTAAPAPKLPPKHGYIRIVRSGVPGPDGVDTNLTGFLAEAKRRGQKVLDVRADEDRNEHVIKVMRLRDAELAALEAMPPPPVPAAPPEEDRPLSDIERKREQKEAKRAARDPRFMYMRVAAGEGGEARRNAAIKQARAQGIKVVDWRFDEDTGHFVIRAYNKSQKRRTKR